MARAVRDLKAIGRWRPLTKRLYRVRVTTRPGRAVVPEDGHLADALYTGIVEDRGSGLYCDIWVWPSALEADLARQRRYRSQGRLERPPPSSLRNFWASILAHELAHCRERGSDEKSALRVERRVLGLLERR